MPKWRNLPKHLQVNRWVDVAADFDLHSIILLLPFSCWGLTFRPHLPLLRNSCLSARPTWLLSKMTLNTASWYFKPQQYSKATNSCRYVIKQKMHFWTGTWEWNGTKGLTTAGVCVLWVVVFFLQPLLTRKNELDKLRKEVKEQWQREQKKMVSWLTSRLRFVEGHTQVNVEFKVVSLTGEGSLPECSWNS